MRNVFFALGNSSWFLLYALGLKLSNIVRYVIIGSLLAKREEVEVSRWGEKINAW